MKAQIQLHKVLKSEKKLDQDAHIAEDKLVKKKKAYDLNRCYSLKEVEIEKNWNSTEDKLCALSWKV